jgi:hypothetical protein
VFGRTGVVTAAVGDYSSFYASLSGSYNNPTWITGLAWSKITGAPSFEPALGNPGTSGFVLSSTTGGVRSWVALPGGSAWITNAATANQTGFASDTYVTGTKIVGTAGSWTAGGTYYGMFEMTKTAAGTAGAIITLRMGTAGTTADAAEAVFTLPAGVAAIGAAVIEVWITFRTVGASGTGAYVIRVTSEGGGFMGTGVYNQLVSGTSITTDTTTLTNIGVSFNGGSVFQGTCRLAKAEYRA